MDSIRSLQFRNVLTQMVSLGKYRKFFGNNDELLICARTRAFSSSSSLIDQKKSVKILDLGF